MCLTAAAALRIQQKEKKTKETENSSSFSGMTLVKKHNTLELCTAVMEAREILLTVARRTEAPRTNSQTAGCLLHLLSAQRMDYIWSKVIQFWRRKAWLSLLVSLSACTTESGCTTGGFTAGQANSLLLRVGGHHVDPERWHREYKLVTKLKRKKRSTDGDFHAVRLNSGPLNFWTLLIKTLQRSAPPKLPA